MHKSKVVLKIKYSYYDKEAYTGEKKRSPMAGGKWSTCSVPTPGAASNLGANKAGEHHQAPGQYSQQHSP